MLAAEGMLKALSGEDMSKEYKDNNNDYDFGRVLQYCNNKTLHSHKLRCPDGQERNFSFDD